MLRRAACLDDLEGEVLEFGEQGVEFLCVVEQGLVFGELGEGGVCLSPVARVARVWPQSAGYAGYALVGGGKTVPGGTIQRAGCSV